ncbi:GNAT family N-acetyltransferase [Marivita sp. S2033]|uniref:GNAT family N-acetyltransferase n=1 Tax=Marivita sp. S2033 TaxID=3373187 RepID=UPI003981CBA3
MTPEAFARLMDRAYTHMRPWSTEEVASSLATPHTVFFTTTHGGLIARIVAGECEILSIATDPVAQRTGVATGLLDTLLQAAQAQGAERVFLDVARSNAAARAFYAAKGFAQVGERHGYYTLRDGRKDDALLLSRPIGAATLPTSQGLDAESG